MNITRLQDPSSLTLTMIAGLFTRPLPGDLKMTMRPMVGFISGYHITRS